MPDSKTTVVQRTAELAPTNPLVSAMKLGFIRRGEMESARTMTENVLWIRDMLSTGEYKDLVRAAVAEKIIGDDLEPRRAFFQLAGLSEDSFTRREHDVRALGGDAVRTLRSIGVSYKEIRMLADAPESARKELRDIEARGGLTREFVETLSSKILEQMEGRIRAQQAARDAEAERERVEGKLKKAQEKVIEKDEEIKKLGAELRDARSGKRTADEKEIDARVDRFKALLRQAVACLSDVDFKESPYARARCVEITKVLEVARANLYHENIAAFEGLEE